MGAWVKGTKEDAKNERKYFVVENPRKQYSRHTKTLTLRPIEKSQSRTLTHQERDTRVAIERWYR